MKILVHDYGGHPFPAELSCEMGGRGHDVVHSWCEAHVSGKGRLTDPAGRVRFESIGRGRVVEKLRFRRRLLLELRFGVELLRQVRRHRPNVALVGNTPVPTLAVFCLGAWLLRLPWVAWQQDVQGVAMASFAGDKLGRGFAAVARIADRLERWCSVCARATVVIADGFLDVHRRWGTADKAVVIPNWAPLDDIVPVPRANAWSDERRLTGRRTLLYAGTLGLKHRPELLTALAERVRSRGCEVDLVVVTEGAAVPVLREDAAARGVPLLLQPFQPFECLSEVLGSGDVLVVLLDAAAGGFSVPSKTLSYLCAGRPVLGLMPKENSASELVEEAGGRVLPPEPDSIEAAADWVVDMLGAPACAAQLGVQSRRLAEREFALAGCADRFEAVLRGAVHA